MQTKIVERYFFFGLLFIVIALSVFVFKPFLAVIAVGASLAVVMHPVYEWLNDKVARNRKWLAALITVLLFLIILCIPLFGLISVIIHQSQSAYATIIASQDANTLIESVNTSIKNFLPAGLDFDLKAQLVSLFGNLASNVKNIFTTTLSTIFSFLLVILTIFYFLKDGSEWRKSIMVLSPLADSDDQKIITKMASSINAVIKGYLLIALCQGVMMGIGMFIFGIPNSALWGVVTGVASLVPTIGTTLVSVPAILFLLYFGHTGAAVGLGIWSLTLVGTIDNFLSPFVIGKSTSIPPLLILFSVLGGVSLMGPIGILLGPLIISLLYALISIYRSGFNN